MVPAIAPRPLPLASRRRPPPAAAAPLAPPPSVEEVQLAPDLTLVDPERQALWVAERLGFERRIRAEAAAWPSP